MIGSDLIREVLFTFLVVFSMSFHNSQDDLIICSGCSRGSFCMNYRSGDIIWANLFEGHNDFRIYNHELRRWSSHLVKESASFRHLVCSCDSVGVLTQLQDSLQRDSVLIEFYSWRGEVLSSSKYQFDWGLNKTPIYFDRFVIANDTLVISSEQLVTHYFVDDSLVDVRGNERIDLKTKTISYWPDHPSVESGWNYASWDVYNKGRYYYENGTLKVILQNSDTLTSQFHRLDSFKCDSGEYFKDDNGQILFRRLKFID